MQKLLFVSPELPYPPRSGGKVKSLKLLSLLSTVYELSLVCPLKLEDADFLDDFKREVPLKSIYTSPINISRSGINLFISYIKHKPLNLYRSYVPGLAKTIENTQDNYDIIFVDHFEAYQYVPKTFKGKVVYHSHNAYFKMWERYSQTSLNPFYRLVTKFEAKRVKQTELSVCDQADLVFAAPNDIDELVALGADSQKFKETYHLGDDTQLSLPDVQFNLTEKRLVYVGFLGWEPNVAGLIWFLEEVWPLLILKEPDLAFSIVGKNPDARLQVLASQYNNIELLGFVENLEDIYPKCRISVAPLQFGSGMKVKVLSAMARGVPIVTTHVGAEGISVENDRHLLIEDEPKPMAEVILDLLKNKDKWQILRDSSRQLIEFKYTWKALFSAMHKAMDDL